MCQGRAGDRKTQDGAALQSGVNRGGAEELKGASEIMAEELAFLDRRGRRWRLGGTIRDAGDLEVGGTSVDGRHRRIIFSSSSNQGAAEGPKVSGISRATTDQGRAGGSRESGGAIRTMVPGGAERGRSQGRTDRSICGWRRSRGIHMPGRSWRSEDLRQIHTI